MPFRKPKYHRDDNAPAIQRAFESVGWSVTLLENVPEPGVPDLLVGGVCGQTGLAVMYLVEVKNPNGRNTIENSQRDWARAWRGPKPFVVRSPQEALILTGRVQVLGEHELETIGDD